MFHHLLERDLISHDLILTCSVLEKHKQVRSTESEAAKELMNMEGASKNLTLHKADLVVPGSFDDIISGCDLVLHVASVFSNEIHGAAVEESKSRHYAVPFRCVNIERA